MKNLLKLSLLSLNLVTFSSMACDISGHSGFMPENNLSFPASDKSAGGITEAQFNRVMDKMESLYSSVVAKTGRKFVIERRWDDAEVNAFAHQKTAGVDTIIMFGGLARHPETTEDGMALVACHELGHHLGGAPKKLATLPWASNEGQADYWGAMKCLRHYFDGDDNEAAVKKLNVPKEVISKCQLVYTNANELAVCERSAMAGLSLGKILSDAGEKVSFTTTDSSTVKVTFDDHPHAQCRLDTYFQGTLCDHDLSQDVSKSDANIGVCTLRNGDKIGNRPLCWFKP